MKLNDYLRGLGIGILLTTLVFAVAGRGKSTAMTDEQIRARAAQLGMMESVTLAERQTGTEDGSIPETESMAAAENMPETESASEAGAAPESESASAAERTSEPESGNVPETESASAAKGAQETESESANQQESAAKQEPESASGQDSAQRETTIEIRPGESSESVSGKLASAGLVESASDFNKFLCDNGYSRKLVVGRHVIPAGADKQKMARILTGK